MLPTAAAVVLEMVTLDCGGERKIRVKTIMSGRVQFSHPASVRNTYVLLRISIVLFPQNVVKKISLCKRLIILFVAKLNLGFLFL